MGPPGWAGPGARGLARGCLRGFAFPQAAAMLGGDEFISSPPRKTVRFGGTLTDILLKYQKVSGTPVPSAAPGLRRAGARAPGTLRLVSSHTNRVWAWGRNLRQLKAVGECQCRDLPQSRV